MTCKECKVGPGAYEAEGPETAILEHYSLLGCADDFMHMEEDSDKVKDVFIGPIEVTEEAYEFAEKIGYCKTCIEVAMNDLANCKNATFWTDDNGFRYSEIHTC